MTFAAALVRADLNVKRLAELSGVSRGTITSVKSGKSCSPATAEKLAAVLGREIIEERRTYMEAIIVVLIGLAGSAAGSLCGMLVSSKLTQYKLEQLEKKVKAHNNLIERTYKLEERTELQEKKAYVQNWLREHDVTVCEIR